ncbi:MAG: choice-of-anchor J domain-containing protein [Gemmatimonadaceae bacterium]|nr:choice-of-anchor J domain-containing protein [Chitinophagaceae bacterium]
MKNKLYVPVILLAFITVAIVACEKDPKQNTTPAPPAVVSNSWKEGFEDAGALGGKGWVIVNNTDKIGQEAWRQGRFESTNKYTFGSDYVVGFPAYVGKKGPHDFISVDMYAGAATSNMSVWLISPRTKMKNGDQIIFYTRHHIDDGSFSSKDGNDRLQVRANFTTGSALVGKIWTETGDFGNLLLDINPGLTLTGYPEIWTRFTITLAGITGLVDGRFAFRYFVAGGGPDGNNASLVGVDELEFKSN